MKRSVLILVVALVLALTSATVAMAQYAGYAYNTNDIVTYEWVQGEWNEDLEDYEYTYEPVLGYYWEWDDDLQMDVKVSIKPHPGYLSWSGALAIMTNSGITDAATLSTPHGGYTATTTKCAVCHSVHRAASDLTAAGVGSYWKLTPGSQSCVACHTPYGASPIMTRIVEWPSNYADGGPHDSFNCLGACHGSIHGGTTSVYGAVTMWNLTNSNDAAITAALAAGNAWTAADSFNYDPLNRPSGIVDATTMTNPPAGADFKENTSLRGIRAMATGYTCGAVGCHTSSQFAVNREGYAEMRASDPANPGMLDIAITGHATNISYGCPPCHMNDIGFYPWNDMTSIGQDSSCALCHDALGKATGTSAFPHANRNITMLETPNGEDWYDKVATGGNLWMYGGDATKRDAQGVPAQNGNANNARARWLIEDNAEFNGTDNTGTPGNIQDGACLKCHAYKYGAHLPGGWPSNFTNNNYKTTGAGTSTGNEFDWSKF